MGIQCQGQNSTDTMSNTPKPSEISVQNCKLDKNGEEIQTVELFGHFEDVEQLKTQMRKVFVKVVENPENSEHSNIGIDSESESLNYKNPELSSSLPNLSIITEKGTEIINRLSKKIISTSLVDVDRKSDPNNLVTDGGHTTLDSSICNSDISTEKQHICQNVNNQITLENCESRIYHGYMVSPSQTTHVTKINTTMPHESKENTTDVPVGLGTKYNQHAMHNTQAPVVLSIDGNNSKLSTVLENIPLVYIPSTKQLVHRNCDKATVSNATISNALSEDLSTKTVSFKGKTESRNYEEMSSSVMNTSINSATGLLDTSANSSTNLLDPAYHNSQFDEERDNLSELDFTDKSDSPLNTLPRSGTFGSLAQTDTSSYGSISSLSLCTGECSANPSINDEYATVDLDENSFMDVNLHGRNSFEKCRNPSQDSGIDDGSQSKRRSGFSSFFPRNLFSRKPKDNDSNSAPGWKLFGKVPPKQPTTAKKPSQITNEYQANQRAVARRKDIEVTSTTALILENRPVGLPSKSPEEELKHRLEYEAMVEAAKKKELKEAKLKKKQMQQQLKLEEQMTQAVKIWNSEILPSWETMHSSKKAKDLWWIGLPPSVRGKVWKLAIGNELNLTSELYEICVSRAEDRIRIMREGDSDSICSSEPSFNKESSVDQIKLDVSRTFPQLCIFQKGGPYYDLLHSLLGAYACYRPDVGYVQGMSFIAAVLLLNMDVADAFICFANLLNKPCQVTFFRVDESMMKSYFVTFEEFLKANLPKLFNHFEKQKLTPDIYIIDWMFTLYSKSLPLDVASRVWDVFCRDGEEFLFRTALGILNLYEDVLLNMDFIHLAQHLTKLPENLSSNELFRNIRRIEMDIDNKKFSQVLAANRDNSKES